MNNIYELMYKNGLSIHEQRLCQPYGDDQRNGLDQFKALESETWEKVLNRVNGVNFGNIYCKTSALGNITSMKPKNMIWQQYSIYLLESLGMYNKDLDSLILPNVRYIGKKALYFNDKITLIDTPKIQVIDKYFMKNNTVIGKRLIK